MGDELGQFAAALQQKFSTQVRGEPENQLRGPFEQLLQGIGKADGLEVQVIGETRLDTGGKPDFGVSIGSLLCGHAELKAPGKGAEPVTTRSNGSVSVICRISSTATDASLRCTVTVSILRLDGNPCAVGPKAASKKDGTAFDALLRDFFAWEPIVPGSLVRCKRCAGDSIKPLPRWSVMPGGCI